MVKKTSGDAKTQTTTDDTLEHIRFMYDISGFTLVENAITEATILYRHRDCLLTHILVDELVHAREQIEKRIKDELPNVLLEHAKAEQKAIEKKAAKSEYDRKRYQKKKREKRLAELEAKLNNS